MTTTPTSGAADLPEALRLAAAISNLLCSNEAAARTLAAAADELVRLHAESEMRRAALLDEMQKAALAAGQPTSAQAADSVQEDSARLDFLIEQRAYVVSDPDACPGHWLRWARPDGSTWVQVDEHPTPRAAIDAARKQGARWQSAVRALTLHI